MRFWDTSSLVPLVVREAMSTTIERLFLDDQELAVWWTARVELAGALARRQRARTLFMGELERASEDLRNLVAGSVEIEPTEEIRDRAIELLHRHGLRAADALQLSAAVFWSVEVPGSSGFVCLDRRLRDAAAHEGFTVLPESLESPA